MIENELSEFDKKLINKIVSLPIERIVPARKTIENSQWEIRSSRINIIIFECGGEFEIRIFLNENHRHPIYGLRIEQKQKYHNSLLKNYLKGLPVILEYDLINQIEHL